MHIFLTGEIHVGKSTILRRWLAAHPDIRLGGFRTVPKLGDAGVRDGVHIVPAAGDAPLVPENCILRCRGKWPNCELRRFTHVFDTVGVSLLEEADGCDVILMDEIGIQEDEAVQFQRAVLARLDGTIPVLGVVRNKTGVLTDAVRRHPNTEIIPVTVENRAYLWENLLEWKR